VAWSLDTPKVGVKKPNNLQDSHELPNTENRASPKQIAINIEHE